MNINNFLAPYGLKYEEEYTGSGDIAWVKRMFEGVAIKEYDGTKIYILRRHLMRDGKIVIENVDLFAQKMEMEDKEKKFLSIFKKAFQTTSHPTNDVVRNGREQVTLKMPYNLSTVLEKKEELVKKGQEEIKFLCPEYTIKKLFNEQEAEKLLVGNIKKKIEKISEKINQNKALEKIVNDISDWYDENILNTLKIKIK